MTQVEALPVGARVVHIGPYKTGTTALQAACHAARDDLAAQGVRFVSRSRHDIRPVRFVTDRLVPGMDPGQAARRWQRMVARTRPDPGGRTFLSSEFLCEASDAQVARIAADIGVGPTWVVITLRPLARLLPSQYQQDVQRGLDEPYDAWLRDRIGGAEQPGDPFWQRHRHDRLLKRWARHFGADRMVLVALDSRDRNFLPTAFEGLLGLRPGTISAHEVIDNNSLAAPEIALMRAFNRHYHATGGDPLFLLDVTREMFAELKVRPAPPGMSPLVTPDWAVRRANEVAAEMIAAMDAWGARIVGDLAPLARSPLTGAVDTGPAPSDIPIDAAERFVSSFAAAARRLLARSGRPEPGPPDHGRLGT